MSLRVGGADETRAALEEVAADVKDLAALATVADTAADAMRGFIPVRTGAARSTITSSKGKGEAVVTFGGSRAPHAFAIARTHPSHFVEKTDRLMEQRAAGILEEGITDTLTRNGLTT